MRHGSPFSAGLVFASTLALACVNGACRADSELLADTAFATVGAVGSPWAASDGAQWSSQDSKLVVAGVSGFSLVWQDMPADRLPAGSVVTCAVTAELVRLAGGRGAWLSVQFHDKFERRIGSASSGTLSEPERQAGLLVRTIVPHGVARASFVLALNGDGEGTFTSPSASASELPPGRLPDAVTVRSGRTVGKWRGMGLSVEALSPPAAVDLGSLSPALWRILIPWGAPGAPPAPEALDALDSLLPRLLAARNECGLEIVLTEGTRANFADELRCAASLSTLAEHVMALRPAPLWVSLLDGPDVSGLLTVHEYRRCADAAAQQLPGGAGVAGPEEWSGALWATAMGRGWLGHGGVGTCVVDVPRRDLPLAADTVTARVTAGAEAGVLRVFSDHPDEAAYGASDEHALDLAALLVRAANAGLAMPVLDLDSGLPLPWLAELVRAFPPRGWVRRTTVEPAQALDALWVTDGRGATRAVAVVNRGMYALPLEIDEPQWERQTRVRKATLSASAGLRADPTVLLARAGKVVDLADSRSVTIYSVP